MSIQPLVPVTSATERVADVLARQATTGLPTSDQAILAQEIAPAGAKNAHFNAEIQGNVIFSDFGGIDKVAKKKNKYVIPPIKPSATPGGSILDTVQGVRNQYMKIQNNIKLLAEKKQDFSSADLLQMQFDVMQLAYINELSSKTADKTSQGAQTLFRNQG